MKTFGPVFSRILVQGCAMLSAPRWPVPPAWTLAKLALESSFDPFAEHPRTHARGLWQSMPVEVHRFPAGTDLPTPPEGHYLRANGDHTTSLMRKYSCPAPEAQLRDAFREWLKYKGEGFRFREALYAANLSPARLLGPYTLDTIIYSANLDDEPLNHRGPAFTRTYWPEAYRENAAAFGKNPKDPRGRIIMRDLKAGLDAAVRRNQARFDAELGEAMLANVRGPVPPDGDGGGPAAA